MKKLSILLAVHLLFCSIDCKTIRILGVMTGTSCDALDATCVEVGTNYWNILWSDSLPYPEDLKRKVFDIQTPGKKFQLKEILHLNRDISEWYGTTLSQIIERHEKKPDVIANHGQTVSHFPERNRQGVTLQLGDPTRIAHLTGLTTVSNFREGDQAAGGDGAPLAPLFHKFLVKKVKEEGVAIHNIGGISNLSYFGPNNTTLAFDTGPGNMLMDAATNLVTNGQQFFDKDGEIALSSSPDKNLLEKLMEHPFFQQIPPKSTGRDDFPPEFLFEKTNIKNHVLVSTATELTIETIAMAYEKWIIGKGLPINLILLCGGGAKNLAILQGLQKRIPKVCVKTTDDYGFDSQYIETQAFVLLGFYSLLGKPLTKTWSSAKGFVPPGHITPGENWNKVLKKLKEL